MAFSKKFAAALAVAATAGLVLSACGNSKHEDTETTTPPAADETAAAETTPATGDEAGDETEAAGGDETLTGAAKVLADAGVATPVALTIQYNPDHYGDASAEEYGAIKEQLEETGLFTVTLNSTEWVTYSQERIANYSIYQLGWFPDYPDADNYLSVFFSKDNFLGNKFDEPAVQALIDEQRVTTDEAARAELISQLQSLVAEYLPTLPLLQGRQVAVIGTNVNEPPVLDASFQFRFANIQKDNDPTAVVKVGTTDMVTSLDPAGSYDNGSYLVQTNVYPMVLSFAPGNPVPTPELAESCEFSEDGATYTCKIKDGLKWANGNTLDANDVKFTFDRQLTIADPEGPSSLLGSLDSVTVPDPLTVEFHLNAPNDVTWEQILASPVGPVVDDEVFSATELTPDADIVAANAFAGAYTIKTWKINEVAEFTPNPDYAGVQGTPQNGGIIMTYYKESSNMRLNIESGEDDVAWRSLTATDIASLESSDAVEVVYGPGGEIRYIVFNVETMPGDTPEQKLAIRQAIAMSIDRDELSEVVYAGTYSPLCSYVPEGLPGANTAVCDLYNQ
ncbi:MAG: ABC transporter substrate-binding protein [Bifidobacteriaceae bacterium]|nr:ABC transporter substrate-binding protein [Bifidobacteriaceae bacterium]